MIPTVACNNLPSGFEHICMSLIDLLNELFEQNPYDGFDTSGFSLSLQGTWGGDSDIFEELIDKTKPNLIIEVGSWKGDSAIHMGNIVLRKQLACKILCIDTWLGSLEHWLKKSNKLQNSWYSSLRIKNGYPQLYYQFLANVIFSGLQEVIIPFPTTSYIGSRWLKIKNVTAPLIYIDASHEEADILLDITQYFLLLEEGGVMFGDDYNLPGVKRAVQKYAWWQGLSVQVYQDGRKWFLEKPNKWKVPFKAKIVQRLKRWL